MLVGYNVPVLAELHSTANADDIRNIANKMALMCGKAYLGYATIAVSRGMRIPTSNR